MADKNLKVNLIANTSKFKSAMSESSSQIRLLNSEFKNAAAETDKYGNKIDSTGAKQKQLSGVVEQHRLRIKAIKDEQKHWTSELKKGNITEEEHARKQQELARRLNNTEAEMKKYEGQLKRLNAEGKNVTRTYADFDRQFRNIGRTMRNVGAQVGITSGIGFMAMKRVLGDVITEAKDFQFQMSEVKAISGATGEQMEKLTQQSKDLGRATKFTAQEAAESQANLARAGFTVNEIYDTMPGLLELAASSNMELGTAANITSNIIRGFNKNAKESGHIADVLAKGAATANTNVEGLGQAMEVAAPVANSLRIGFESVAAAAGIMADAGIDGTKSGRMLRQGMLRLSKPTGQAAKVLKNLGVNAFDADGNMKSLDLVVAELEKGLKGQSKQARAAALATIFGSESTAGWTVLLEKGSKELANYTKELENSDGAAKQMADTMIDNAEGALVIMQSALSGMKIELGEKLLPLLKRGAEYVTGLADKFQELDDSTVQTIAETALLVTAVLGVTTAVAGLVTGIGALMAFAGPVGLAIVGGTLLLGGLAAAIYKNTLETEALKKEQEKAKEEALRYGDNLSEGTKKGVKGYTDLYEGAKLKMLELKNMSGKEADETVKEIQNAFSKMGDTVIAELEKQRDDLKRVIREVYTVAGEYGKKAADELSNEIVERFQKDISEYEKAVSTVNDIVEKYGGEISEYPAKVRQAYDEALATMEQGSAEFARTHQELLNVQKSISEKEGKLLYAEQEKYAKQVNDTYKESIDSINTWYADKTEVINQALAQDKLTAEEHERLMTGIEASINKMFSSASDERDKALRLLSEHADTRGQLIDVMNGQEFERQEIMEVSNERYGAGLKRRTETDEEYLQRWLDHTSKTLKSQGKFNEDAKRMYIGQLEEFLISLGNSKDEAKKISKQLVDESLGELEKGDDKAKQAGKDKGDAHKDGIESTSTANKHAGESIKDSTLHQLSKGSSDAESSGKSKGTSHAMGIEKTEKQNYSAGKNVAEKGKDGLASVKTEKTGYDFVQGFKTALIGSGNGIWSVAWNLGKKALSALKQSIDSHSPSKETEKEGYNFTEGFNIAIADGGKKVVKNVNELGTTAVKVLADNVKKTSKEVDYVTVRLNDQIKQATKKTNQEINVINKKANAEAKQIEKRAREDILSIKRKAKSKERKITKDESIRIRRIEEDTANKVKKVHQKASKDIQKVEKDKSKKLDEIRAKEFQKSVDWIEYKKEHQNASLMEELSDWERVQARYAKGTKQREEAEKNVLRVKTEIHDKLIGLNDEYLQKMKDVNDEYEQAVTQRFNAIKNTFGLFDEIGQKDFISGSTLIDNLKGQVNELEDWSSNLKILAQRGIDDGLLKELQEMGPRAANEISALVRMSDEELTEFEQLWKEKTQLAREQALHELEGLRIESEEKLQKLQTEWISKIEGIRLGTKDELRKMPSDLKIIGNQAISGMINGMDSMRGPLMAKARELANAVKAEMQAALEINSPSKVMEKDVGKWVPAGVAVGIEDNIAMVKQAMHKMANAIDTQKYSKVFQMTSKGIAKTKLTQKENTNNDGNIEGLLKELIKVMSNQKSEQPIIIQTRDDAESIARAVGRANRRTALRMG